MMRTVWHRRLAGDASELRGTSCRGFTVVSAAVSLFIVLMSMPPARASDLIVPGAQLVQVHAAARYFEGPTWDPVTARLYFTQLTSEYRILRLTPPDTVTVWMDNTQSINGTFLGVDGRLLCAQEGARRILSLRIGADGPEDPVTLASNPLWKPPNDLCQAPSGDIYFTTPDFAGRTASVVYHLSPTGAVTPIITEMTLPNGIITSLDGDVLYVSDSHQKWWRSYPILPGGGVGAGSIFFNPATSNTADPDGMSIDEHGNLYLTGRGGVWIVSPAGAMLEMIPVPQFVSNVTFGGADGRTLYLTCDQRVYSLAMQVRGGPWREITDPNNPPGVDAGGDRIIALPSRMVSLDGTVTDDGRPDPPAAVTVAWTRIAGPGQVTFADASAAATTAGFSTLGVYTLRLAAFDGARWGTDEVVVTVARTGDFDADGDVDGADTSRFNDCRTGAGLGPLPAGCASTDLDEDHDVDQSDYGIFQRCIGGAFAPADADCGG